jgi:hypothetical protein
MNRVCFTNKTSISSKPGRGIPLSQVSPAQLPKQPSAHQLELQDSPAVLVYLEVRG